jgi:hypothetical protein
VENTSGRKKITVHSRELPAGHRVTVTSIQFRLIRGSFRDALRCSLRPNIGALSVTALQELLFEEIGGSINTACRTGNSSSMTVQPTSISLTQILDGNIICARAVQSQSLRARP